MTKLYNIYLWRDIFADALEQLVESSLQKYEDGVIYVSISDNSTKIIEALRHYIRTTTHNFGSLKNIMVGSCAPSENILITKLFPEIPVINNNWYICSDNCVTLNYALINNCAKELFDLYFNDINEVKKDFNVTNITFLRLGGYCADLLTHCIKNTVLLPQLTDLYVDKQPMLVDCNTFYKYDVTSHIMTNEDINILNKLISP